MNFLKPLRQGLTVYQYAIINFKENTKTSIELKPELEFLKTINPKFEKKMENVLYYEAFGRILRYVSKINITIPGDFRST